jgi:hypothetical protein
MIEQDSSTGENDLASSGKIDIWNNIEARIYA